MSRRDDLAKARNRLGPDDDSGDGPLSLPEIKAKPVKSNLDGNRICKKCGNEGRVVSGDMGVNVFCNHCKDWWPVSGPRSPDKMMPLSPPRGLSKQTRVSPDVSIAFEPDEE